MKNSTQRELFEELAKWKNYKEAAKQANKRVAREISGKKDSDQTDGRAVA